MQNPQSYSYWERKTYFENIDYLIIGAGIVGYSTALSLRKSNPDAKILILERGLLPYGASSKNAGFACFGSATELYDDLQHMQNEDVWKTVELRWKGLKKLRELHGDSALGFQQHGSWDLFTPAELPLFEEVRTQLAEFNQRMEAITGEKEVFCVDDRVSEKFGFNGVITSFYNRLEGQIDTGKMNQSFYKKVIEANILVLFGKPVVQIDPSEDAVVVSTENERFRCQQVAICTNGFAKQFIPEEDIVPARAQVIITQKIPQLSVKGTFHFQKGYYYFRDIDDRLLFGGGRNLDLKGEQTTAIENTTTIVNELERLLHEMILPGTPVSIEHQWAGIMGVGQSKKPIIKQVAANCYGGVRLGGMGVAIGTLVGEELAELIQSKSF